MSIAELEAEVRSQAHVFVAELTAMVQQGVLAAVRATLEGEAAPAARKAPIAKISPASRTRPPAKRVRAARSPAAAARPPRKLSPKRDPAELAKLIERLAEYIKANPGQRMGRIMVALGVPRRDLALPLRKLIETKRVTARGKKRGTVYTPV
jgi:hypothetical protein